MSELNSLLTSLGLSPESDNSQFLTTSNFRRYNSNLKTTKQQPCSGSSNFSNIPVNPSPSSKRKLKSDKSVKKSTKRLQSDPEPELNHEPPQNEPSTDACSLKVSSSRKVARYCPRFDQISFQLKCEWNDCESVWNTMDDFLDHVDSHLKDVDLLIDLANAGYDCQWAECDFMTFMCVDTFKRHVRFHAFHTKLKEIGQNVLNSMELNSRNQENNPTVPKCNLERLTRNIIPELPLKFECAWSNCGYSNDNPELIVLNKSRLIEHMRHHSQEKLCSCPVCGALFSSFTRFIDHCNRSSDPGSKFN